MTNKTQQQIEISQDNQERWVEPGVYRHILEVWGAEGWPGTWPYTL